MKNLKMEALIIVACWFSVTQKHVLKFLIDFQTRENHLKSFRQCVLFKFKSVHEGCQCVVVINAS